MSGTENINPETLAYIEELRQREEENKQIIEETLQSFKNRFPPAERNKSDDSMTTEEIFHIINQHIPDAVAVSQLPRLLRKMGYISDYDPNSQAFAWLIQ